MTPDRPTEAWLARCPADWARSRVRNVARLSPTYSGAPPMPGELCTVLPMERLSEDGAVDASTQASVEELQAGLTLFERGDVLFAKITPCMENGKGAFVRYLPTRYAFGSTEYHVLRPSRAVVGGYLYYVTFDPAFRAYAAENMTGAAGQKRVSSRFLKDTRIFLPPLPEQSRIAAYLDASCAALDAAVAAKRGQLDTLDALRRSMVERAVTRGLAERPELKTVARDWLEAVPAHWHVCHLKRVLARMDYGISVSTEEEGRYPVLKMGDIVAGEVVFASHGYVDEVEENLLLDTGDLLYNRTNSPDQVGKLAIFRGTKADAVTFASYLVRLRVNHKADPEFLTYLLNSDGFLGFARRLAIPSVQQSNLNSTRYGRMVIPLPPLAEQREIVEFLSGVRDRFAQLKANLDAQIQTLLAYRKSLIHECVTGQRRVTDADVAQAGAGRSMAKMVCFYGKFTKLD